MAGDDPLGALDGVDLPRLALAALAVAVLVVLVVAASTSTAAFGAYNPSWDGTTELRRVAGATGAEPEVVRGTARYDAVRAEGTVAVVLSPDEAYGEDAARLRRFVERGGTLVVAEDYGGHSNALLDAVGADARFDGTPLRDVRRYHRSPALPVASNVAAHPLTRSVDGLTLNHGTALRPGEARVLVRTSGFAHLDADRDGALDDDEALRRYPVVAVERVGEGRVVTVSDPSVFVNAMLDRPGNRAFARALFAAHDRALFDVSHAGLPPLAHALVVVRSTPPLQAALGLAALAAVAAWGRGVRPLDALGRSGADRSPPSLDAEAVAAHLRRRHPDWDEARVRRVTEGVMVGRGEREADE